MYYMNGRSNISHNNRGSTLFVVFGIITVLYIFGVSFLYMTTQQVSYIKKMEARINARYLAESVVEKAARLINSEFQRELVFITQNDDGEDLFEVNKKLMDLIDIKRIEDFVKTHSFSKDELIKGGKASVIVEVLEVKSNEFYTYIDYQEKIPENLKYFRNLEILEH